MNESGKYEVYLKKLDGICEENGLTYALRTNRYPCTLTIKPLGGDGGADLHAGGR